MRARLNIFQRTMLHWNAQHPYNAVHLACLPGVLPTARLETRIARCLDRLGLRLLTLGADGRSATFETGEGDCEVRVLAAGGQSPQQLLTEMEEQLNRPFASDRPFCPFRFFAVPAGDSFWLGVAYFHPIADAEAVVNVLKAVAASLTSGHDRVVSCEGQSPVSDRRVHLLARHPGALLHKLLCLPQQIRTLRRCYRPRYRDLTNLRVGLAWSCLAQPELEALLAGARRWDVTVNDVLLAMLLRALAPLAAARLKARRRRRLAVGCVASLRRDLPEADRHRQSRPAVHPASLSLRRDLPEADRHRFGLLLGMFVVSHEVPPGLGLAQLARDIRRQTLRIKQHKLHLAACVDLAIGRGLLRFFSPEGRLRFYPKHHPLWGGLTNMNLNALWTGDEPAAPRDYLRAVATGPAMPLVLSATTIRDHLNLCWSYRTEAFTRAEIETVQGRFADQVAELGDSV